MRALALAKFGYDLDDSASYPRAGAALLRTGRANAMLVLAHLEEVLTGVARHFFEGVEETTLRSRAKKLFNLLHMDGAYASWRAEYNDGVPGRVLSGAQVPLHDTDGRPTGMTFDLATYVAEQPQRTEEMAVSYTHLTLPTMVQV